MIEFTDGKDIDDIALLTKARDTLADENVMLIEGTWANIMGCCTLGAATLPWERTLGASRTAWKMDMRYRVAALLVDHIDMGLVDAAHNSGALTEDQFRLIIDPEVDKLHRITAYSDYVLYPRMDGKKCAIELYNRAIAAELAKRVEVRAGADA